MSKAGRRKYLIDPSFQINFILKFCIIVIISSIAIGGAVFLLTQNSTTVAIENTKVQVKSTSHFILPTLVTTVFITSVFAALAILVLALFVTHRIVGPIFRLRREIDYMQEGDLNRNFGIRKKDQLQELAKSLSLMSKNYKDKHTELKVTYDSLVSYLEARNYCVSDEEKEDLSKILNKMDETLEFFKI